MHRLTIVAIVLATLIAIPAAAEAQVVVEVGKTVKVPLPRQPLIIGVEDPKVASIAILPKGELLVTGKKVGSTRIVGRDHAHVPIVMGVSVVPEKKKTKRKPKRREKPKGQGR